MANSIKKEKKQESKLMKKILKAPVKFLAGARDFYVKSMMVFDGQMGRYAPRGAIVCPNHCITVLPRSFSASSTGNGGPFVDEEDYVERENSASRMRQRSGQMERWKSVSMSVGVERIDEDKACEFGEEVMVKTRSCFHPRTNY